MRESRKSVLLAQLSDDDDLWFRRKLTFGDVFITSDIVHN